VAVEEGTRFQDFGSGKIAYSPMKDRNKFSVLDPLKKRGISETASIQDT
jgi:hypothetical protein